MASLSMFQSSNNKHHLRISEHCMKMVKKGHKKSPINLSLYVYLLDAEYSVIKKKYKAAEKLYYVAIEQAAIAGVIQIHVRAILFDAKLCF